MVLKIGTQFTVSMLSIFMITFCCLVEQRSAGSSVTNHGPALSVFRLPDLARVVRCIDNEEYKASIHIFSYLSV